MLDGILEKCSHEQPLTRLELTYLLSQTEKPALEQIFRAARAMREKQFGNQVFLYGFVYFSTYCKNECAFCYYRASNQEPPRYRKTKEEIVQTAVELKEAGIHLIDLTLGEDPYYLNHPERLVEIVQAVKQATNLPVMVSPGLVDNDTIDQLAEAGADWYALYQETHNPELFAKARLNQSFEDRMAAKQYARSRGMLVEEGLLTGIGDTTEDAVHSMEMMAQLQASQVRTMTFIPQAGTPFAHLPAQGFDRELLYIAVMRLLFPRNLIPASLDVDGLRGLQERLDAGANVVTSIIPPCQGYCGVANAEFDVDEGYRTIDGIQETLTRCGLEGATAQAYQNQIESMKAPTITEVFAVANTLCLKTI